MLNFEKALYLHTGGERISRDDLAYTDTPAATPTFCPVPHAKLLTQMYNTFADHNINILQEQFAVSKQGQRMFGVIELESEAADYSTIIAVRNAHDHSESIKLGLGTGVFVCDNLAFSAEFMMRRKHTAHVMRDLPKQIGGLIAKAQDARHKQKEQITAYKNTPLDEKEAHHLMALLAKSGAFPVTKFLEVEKEFAHPRHDEFMESGHTAWTLMNAVTEVLKGTSLLALPDRTMRLHSILDHHIGPVLTPMEDIVVDEFGQMDFAALLDMPAALIPDFA
jgi:hypothetical protein